MTTPPLLFGRGHALRHVLWRGREKGKCHACQSYNYSWWTGAQGPADMHDELFGHCLAALRFGVSHEACKAAIGIAFELNPTQAEVSQLPTHATLRLGLESSCGDAHQSLQS